MVTATLPAFVKNGSAIDVTVSSLGDAKSLQGGTLAANALAGGQCIRSMPSRRERFRSADFSREAARAAAVAKNFVTVGRIPGGALVEQDVTTTLQGAADNSLAVTLNQPDYTTAARLADAIRAHLPEGASGAQRGRRRDDSGVIRARNRRRAADRRAGKRSRGNR